MDQESLLYYLGNRGFGIFSPDTVCIHIVNVIYICMYGMCLNNHSNKVLISKFFDVIKIVLLKFLFNLAKVTILAA